jgi:crotonobetainyl-CoA:carnitine CoA-transferase CaiB-like acyl-CoA transferase
VAALSNLGMGYLATGRTPRRQGNRLSTVYPSDNFRCSDGDLMLIVGNDAQFRSFCRALGMPEVAQDPRFARNEARLENHELLAPLIAQAFAKRTVAGCQVLLDEAGVPASRINDVAQVFEDPQVVAREMVREVERPDGRKVRMIASPMRLSRTPPQSDRLPPTLGQHTTEDGWV